MPLTAIQTIALYSHAKRLTRRLADRLHATGINVGDLEALAMIDLLNDPRPTDLAIALDRATPTISHVLTRLATAGLIEHTPHPKDRRARVLTLTAAGKTALAHALADLNPLLASRTVLDQVARAANRA